MAAPAMTLYLRRLFSTSSSPFRLAIQQHLPFRLSAQTLPKYIPQYLLPLTVTTFANVAGFLSTLWDSILLAVPKKRSSYSKKRSRQLAGKGLKDIINLGHCSACGRIKRMHILCPYCVQNIKDMWAGRLTKQDGETRAQYRKKHPTSKSMELAIVGKKK